MPRHQICSDRLTPYCLLFGKPAFRVWSMKKRPTRASNFLMT